MSHTPVCRFVQAPHTQLDPANFISGRCGAHIFAQKRLESQNIVFLGDLGEKGRATRLQSFLA